MSSKCSSKISRNEKENTRHVDLLSLSEGETTRLGFRAEFSSVYICVNVFGIRTVQDIMFVDPAITNLEYQ